MNTKKNQITLHDFSALSYDCAAQNEPATNEDQPVRLLVVDDERTIRESLAKLLEAEGYEVTLAADGGEALAQFNSKQFNAVLLDLNMPVLNGWDTFERVTTAKPLVPVIIITGRIDQYKKAAVAGASALIEKPLDVPFLLKTLKQLLAEPPEIRLRRLCGKEAVLRYGAPDTGLFGQSLLQRFSTPYRWPNSYPCGGLNE